jgi:hypothetical protein
VIVIPSTTPAICEAIIRRAQRDIPIIENPAGSNRSPEIDAMCKRFGVPLASYWCALWVSDVWKDAGAEIPPVSNAKAWHPAICQTWLEWSFETGRFSSRPGLGFAALFGTDGNQPAKHIACCVVALSPHVYALEGNTSEAGFSRNGELAALKRTNLERLIGYVSPLPLSIADSRIAA